MKNISKRFFIIMYFGTLVGAITLWSVGNKDAGNVALGLGIIGAIISFYVHLETKRPSEKK